MVSRRESVIFFFTTVCRWWIGSSFLLESMPSYCSKDMSYNEIPSLAASVESSFNGSVVLDQVKLLQVQAVIRHGARAPFAKPLCWAGYDFTWDCNVTEEPGSSYPGDGGNRVEYGPFRKVYDANIAANALQGTCAMGQLLEEGFEQEMENGRHLREAYVCDGSYCLFDDDSAANLQNEGSLYLRSDDSQRTIMSGQVLTANMLNVADDVKLEIHTADYLYDYLHANPYGCPPLTALSEAAFNSSEWNAYQGSSDVEDMAEDLREVWQVEPNWVYVLDCLMTTACTSRQLPEGMTEKLFNDTIQYYTNYVVFESSFNNGSYAKLGISKLVSDMRKFFMEAMGSSSVKFLLISGHDTTFVPLLTAIAPDSWDKQWPAYASLASLELLQIEGGVGSGSDEDDGDGTADYFFRLVYNGKVLRVAGCEADICPVSKFLEATEFASDLEGQCDVQDDSEESTPASVASNPSSSPAPIANNGSSSETAANEGSISSSAAEKGSTAKSGSTSSGAVGDPGSAANANAFGVAVTCFLIGGLVVAVPAAMYFRRFRYEAMRDTGHRDNYGW